MAKMRMIQNIAGLTGKLIQPNSDKVPADVSNSALPRLASVVGSCEIIEVKIISEIPLPIPCSVMSSPNHIRIMEPATMAVTDSIQSAVVGVYARAVFEAITDWYRMKM